MKVEDIDSIEKENLFSQREKNESVWNEHKVSTFQIVREKELAQLYYERPSKSNNLQLYYNYKAREEQIKYELETRRYLIDFISGSLFEAAVHYGHAMNHLKRRGEYEKKLYAVWLQRVKAQENPPTPDIEFINLGIKKNLLRDQEVLK